MIKTQARDMMEKMQDLTSLGVMDCEMTQHPIAGGTLMNFPSNYRGLAKVTKVRDEAAKNWLGTDTVLYIDMESGESNLLDPSGQMMSVQDITRTFDLEAFTPTPNNDL